MSSGNDGAFQNICWLFEDAAGVHGGDGTATSACWIQPGDAGVCAGIGADPSTVCSSLTGTWAAHISDTGYDADLVCFISALTGGSTCSAFCGTLGRACVKAMDNVNRSVHRCPTHRCCNCLCTSSATDDGVLKVVAPSTAPTVPPRTTAPARSAARRRLSAPARGG